MKVQAFNLSGLMPYKKRILAIFAVIALFLLLSIPVNRQIILSPGTDSYKSHHALYGKRVKSQNIQLQGNLHEVGAILVNLRRADNIPPTQITLRTTDGTLIAEQSIPPENIKDDVFTWVNFSPLRFTAKNIQIEFSAPAATNDNAIGLRFDKEQDDHLALALIEYVPVWRYIQTSIQQNKTLSLLFLGGILASLLVTIATQIPEISKLSAKQRQILKITFICVLVLLAVGVRFQILSQLKGVSGGDAYNYLSITRQISNLNNPFSVGKRLPGYPALLLPAFLTPIDDIWFMRAISILSAGGILVLLSLLARHLKLPWSVQLISISLLAFQKDFFWVSLRPEPYTLYAFLLLLALVLFFQLKRPRYQILFGIVLGYTAMVRQEGFVLALILGLCSLAYWRQLRLRGYLRIIIPALLLVMPFFVHNTLAFGNPIYTPYFAGERLQIVNSWTVFQDNLGATWGILGSLWKPSWNNLSRVSLSHKLFLLGAVAVIIRLTVLLDKKVLTHRTKIGASIIISSLLIAMTGRLWLQSPGALFGETTMIITAGALIASSLFFLVYARWRGVVILLVLLSQILIAIWFHPFSKHYQQSYPLLILILTTALIVPLRQSKKPLSPTLITTGVRTLYNAAIIVPFFLVGIHLFTTINAAIDKSDQKTAPDFVVYQAIKVARQLPGPHGFDNAYQVARIYFPDETPYYGDDRTPEKIQAWLARNNIKTLVVTTIDPAFSQNIDPAWKQVAYFISEGKDERLLESFVYQID